jgi:hypothetical protein
MEVESIEMMLRSWESNGGIEAGRRREGGREWEEGSYLRYFACHTAEKIKYK